MRHICEADAAMVSTVELAVTGQEGPARLSPQLDYIALNAFLSRFRQLTVYQTHTVYSYTHFIFTHKCTHTNRFIQYPYCTQSKHSILPSHVSRRNSDDFSLLLFLPKDAGCPDTSVFFSGSFSLPLQGRMCRQLMLLSNYFPDTKPSVVQNNYLLCPAPVLYEVGQ